MTATGGGTPRPRVLHVLDSLAVGGLELALLGLIERTGDRFEHSVCCIRDLGALMDRFANAGAGITLVGKRVGRDRSVPWRIARLCRALRPHIVHTRNWATIDGVVAARLARVPVVIHGEHGRDDAEDAAPSRRQVRICRLLFRFVNRIVVVSKRLQRWLVEELAVRPRKVVFIPNGVDTERFRPSAHRDRLRRTRGYEPAHVLIGALGRLQAIKDYATLIAAFETVLRRQPEARLVIVGDGPERASLADEVDRRRLRHAVRLAGHQDDVEEWLAAMDLFVHPSLMEGTSNALLEAMAVGLPVVAGQVGGNPEIVVDGVTGRLVPIRDPAALAAAMRFYSVDVDARRQHGATGRARVAQGYSMDAMVAGYTAVYQQALARRSSRWLAA